MFCREFLPAASALLLVVGLAAAAPAASKMQARFTPSRSSCFAPCDIHFDATGSTHPDLEDWERLVDLTYAWNFGDPLAGNWPHGASHHDKNVDTGFVAGHVFDRPGRFDVTLTVRDGRGETVTQHHGIEVHAADTVFPGDKTACIASSGRFEGCPGGAVRVTSQDFDASLRKYCRAPGYRCLFRRGDGFVADNAFTPSPVGPHMTGAFGSGDKPRVDLQGPTSVFEGPEASGQIVFADLDIRGTDERKQRVFDSDGRSVRNTLLYRIDMRDISTSVHLYAGGARFVPGRNMPTNISIVECTSLSNSNSTAVIYSSAEKLLFLGNDFGDRDGEQHIVRIGWTRKSAISHNSLGRECGKIRHVLKIHNHKAGESDQCVGQFVVADNLIESCTDDKLDVEIAPNSSRGAECVEHFVVERNHFRQSRNLGASHRSLAVSGQGVAIRNNIFDLSGAHHNSTARGLTIRVKTENQHEHVMPRDIRVFNNACYMSGETPGKGKCLEILSGVENVQLKNNLLYDPTGRAVLIFQNGASNISTCAEGSDCNLTTRESPFVSAKPFDFLSFSLRGGSPALDAGELVPATDIRFTGATQPPPDARSLHLGPFQSRGLAPSEAPLPARQASGP